MLKLFLYLLVFFTSLFLFTLLFYVKILSPKPEDVGLGFWDQPDGQ